jgi:predicted O-methyltransferase YrrM
MTKGEVLAAMHIPDAFAGPLPSRPGAKVWGWTGDAPIFGELIEARRPKLIVEVGSWVGQSALTMVAHLSLNGLDSAIICVDTWLGAYEHWEEEKWRATLNFANGRPTIYEDFLANVAAAGYTNTIVPLTLPSSIAARILARWDIRPDLIYIDGAHDADSVHADIVDYYKILAPRGLMFGDDWAWPSVQEGVKLGARRLQVDYTERGMNWFIRKP